LARGENWSHLPWLVDKLKSFFPDYAGMTVIEHRRNSEWAQAAGIDALITLRSSKTLSIDVKLRSSAYPDVLLEVVSNVERGKPGWIEKDLAMDYLAYGIEPTQTLYLFPFLQLQRAWRMNKADWIRTYGLKTTSTGGWGGKPLYTTQFCSVPVDVLKAAAGETLKA